MSLLARSISERLVEVGDLRTTAACEDVKCDNPGGLDGTDRDLSD